ncbi:hypothetical protein V496_03774 [Pseudogymnoascus sp. VKM F-4515 (FW-2607)]|nr:hypothetical protein V496_03774 [Pseudogymnoascus sp. VKM F-4515 (FW-2607)]KFY87902.1 hypothetical protein V498_06973 [Pseudogymnoascus sp. VKM F-4517 (FW-2822)]
MNSYRGSTIGAPSKATPSTLCQKCLKRGHYSYECKAVAQERPYVSRPSRTQQLFNPKLVPKLTNDAPQDLSGSKGKQEEQLAKTKLEEDRGRKRDRDGHDLDNQSEPKRLRSTSSRSSVSVSTVSTNAARSPPPSNDRKRDQRKRRRPSPGFQADEGRRSRAHGKREEGEIPSGRGRHTSRSRSASSYSSVSTSRSRSPRHDRLRDKPLRRYSQSQTPPRQRRAYSPKRDDGQYQPLGRSTERTGPSDTTDRRDAGQARGFNGRNDTRTYRENQAETAPRRRSPSPRNRRVERSLSPFSQRVALTKALGR